VSGKKEEGEQMMKQLKMAMCLFVSILALVFLGQVQSMAAGQMDTSRFTYNIEAQSLKSALEIYQKTSGLNLAYSDDLVQGKMTDGVYGKNTTAQALKKILQDTALTYTITNQGTVVLRKHKMVVAQREVGKRKAAEEKEEIKRPVEMEQMVVTATKTEEKISDIPASVSVIYGEEMEASGARVIQDVLHHVPGIMLNDVSGNGTLTMMTMRGMPSTNSQYILVLVDGVPQNTPADTVRWATIPMENVERIEVIRGPASALYGMNAMGGVINIITKKPTPGKEFIISAGYGSYDENKQKAAFSGTAGSFGYNFGVVRRESDGWRDENNHFEQYNTFGKITYDFNENSNLSLNLAYSDWDHEWPENIPIDDYHAGRREDGIYKHGEEKNRQTDDALIYEHRFNKQFKITNRLYSQSVDNEWKAIVDIIDQDLDSLRIGDEIQFEIDHDLIGRENKIVMGYHYEHQDVDVIRRFSEYFLPFLIGKKMVDNETTRQIHSGYFQDIFHLTERIILTAGVRYDYVDFDFGEDTMDHWSPKVGMTIKPIEQLSLFANVSTGFKTPTASQVARYSELDPEKAVSYEVGIRASLFNRFAFSVAYYHTDLTDQLTLVADPSDPVGFRLTNAGESEMDGVELELTCFVYDGLSFFANYNYNKSKFTDFYDAQMDVDYTGNYLAWQPKNKVAGGIRYEHPIGIKACLTTKWLDEQYLSNANEYTQDSYTITDLNVSYTYKRLGASLAVRNLFDEDYATYGENWGGGDAFLTTGDPVTVFGELTCRF
jgi:iron complex outermembrane receptor protein